MTYKNESASAAAAHAGAIQSALDVLSNVRPKSTESDYVWVEIRKAQVGLRAMLAAAPTPVADSGADEPVAYLSTDPKLWGGSRIKKQGTFTIPVYTRPAAPQPHAPAGGGQAVAKIVAVDEYGPRIEWTKHWVELVGASLYASPPAPAADGRERSEAIKLLRDIADQREVAGFPATAVAIRRVADNLLVAPPAVAQQEALTDEQIDALVISARHSDPHTVNGDYYLTKGEIRALLAHNTGADHE